MGSAALIKQYSVSKTGTGLLLDFVCMLVLGVLICIASSVLNRLCSASQIDWGAALLRRRT